ncbi:DUF2975 domain-containing protein [Dysgonomonas sp.]|nr:DUF2975 domain-containing protein [Prevotella sp.]
MNLKIKIYCILLTIVYIVIIVNSAYQGSADFMEGFKNGKDRNYTSEIYDLNLEPKDGKYTFQEQIKNEKDNQYVSAEVRSYLIKTNTSYSSIPSGLKIIKLVCLVSIVFLVLGLLFSPILFFSIIYSITKNRIITSSLVLRTRVLGWLLILFSIIDIIYTINNTMILSEIMKIENYEIVMGQPDYMMLVLGLVILILAEILKMSLKIKEEQDLTI